MGPPSEPASGPLPDYIGRYRVRSVLGSGGFATVFLAEDEALEDEVAVKVLAQNWAYDPDVRSRFISEARVMRSLDADHVVRVLDIGEWQSQPFIVMELADAGTLAGRLSGPWSRATAEPVLDCLVQALGAVHGKGVVHRDLKPANLLIRGAISDPDPELLIQPGERLLLGDFGLAKDYAAASGFTIAAGTPVYAAPEQLEPGASVDGRADLFGATAILCEVLTGRPPAGKGDAAFDAEQNDLLGPLAPVLLRSLRPDPDLRPADVDAWADELRWAWPASRTVDEPGPPTPQVPQPSDPQPADPARRSTGRAARFIVGALALALAATVVVWLGSAGGDDVATEPSDVGTPDETATDEAEATTTSPPTTAGPVPSTTVPVDPPPSTTAAEPTEPSTSRLLGDTDLPTVCGSVTPEATAVEPGVSQLVASCTIAPTVPGAALVFATGTATSGSTLLGLPESAVLADVVVTEGPPTGEAVQQTIEVSSRTIALEAGDGPQPFAASATLDLAAGERVLGLALRNGDAGTAVVEDVSITVVFVPAGSDRIRLCSDVETRTYSTAATTFGTDRTSLVAECGIRVPAAGTIVTLGTAMASSELPGGGRLQVFDDDGTFEESTGARSFDLAGGADASAVSVLDAREVSEGEHFVGVFAAANDAAAPLRLDATHMAVIWVDGDHPDVGICFQGGSRSREIPPDERVELASCRLDLSGAGQAVVMADVTVSGGPVNTWIGRDGDDPTAGGATRRTEDLDRKVLGHGLVIATDEGARWSLESLTTVASRAEDPVIVALGLVD